MSTDLKTSIQWADFTWNFVRGCIKVDDDCKFCYMYRDAARYGKDGKDISLISKTTANKKLRAAKALAAERKAAGDNTPVRIFCSSWTDVFLDHPLARVGREELWRIARENPELTLMVLTKRPELIPEGLPHDWGKGYPNVWMGTSVGSDTPEKRKRIVDLLLVPARVRFLSMEPLHGDVMKMLYHIDTEVLGFNSPWCQINPLSGRHTDMARPCEDVPKIDWVIVGGESGNDTGKYRYRECKLEWITGVVGECRTNGTAVYVKQLGTHLAKKMKLKDRHGGDPSEWPLNTFLHLFQHPDVKS